jgi:hypothetical protein
VFDLKQFIRAKAAQHSVSDPAQVRIRIGDENRETAEVDRMIIHAVRNDLLGSRLDPRTNPLTETRNKLESYRNVSSFFGTHLLIHL